MYDTGMVTISAAYSMASCVGLLFAAQWFKENLDWRQMRTFWERASVILALAVVVIGGGAGWYFKIYRPKQHKAAEPEEDYSDYDEPDDYDDEPPWDVDDEDEGGDE